METTIGYLVVECSTGWENNVVSESDKHPNRSLRRDCYLINEKVMESKNLRFRLNDLNDRWVQEV